MSHQVTELQSLGEALGLALVDELSAFRQKFDQTRHQPAAEAIAFLMPLMDGLLESAAKDRSSVHGWCLNGHFNNVQVNVRPVSASAGTGSGAGHTETQVQALFEPPLSLGLKITNEALVSRIAQKLTGKRDLQTGNRELDRAIHLEARDAASVQLLLADSQIQRVLLDAYSNYPWPIVTDKAAQVDHYGFIDNVDVLKKSLNLVTGIVLALSRRANPA